MSSETKYKREYIKKWDAKSVNEDVYVKKSILICTSI